MSQLAPISIATYSRLEHLIQTIESLKLNSYANKSILYIFSDAPRAGHEESVNKLRDYIKTVEGFAEVRVFLQPNNDMKKNIRESYEIPLAEFGRVIWMEDDNIVADYFLEYMNEALEFYKDDQRVISIAGHSKFVTSPLKEVDVFKLNAFHAWGVGYWSRSITCLQSITLDLFSKDIDDDLISLRLSKLPDTMLYNYIPCQINNIFDAGDVKYHYYMAKNDLYSIYPTETLVRNIGCDGTGFHCDADESFMNQRISLKRNRKLLELDAIPDLTEESNKVDSYSYKAKIRFLLKFPKYSLYLLKFKINLKIRRFLS